MRSRSLSLLAALAVALLPACAKNTPSATASPADEAAVRALSDRYADAFNKRDAKAFSALFTEDYEDVDPTGKHTQGRAARRAGSRRLGAAAAGREDDRRHNLREVVERDVCGRRRHLADDRRSGRHAEPGSLDGSRGQEGQHMADDVIAWLVRHADAGHARYDQAKG